jgi:spermidine synthase
MHRAVQSFRGPVPVLLLAFFLSGCVALVYQVLWTRQLGLLFGVTIQAASTVLASFMAGVALGSYFAGRWSERLANPLRTFAWVEVLIGCSALVTPLALAAADGLFVRISPMLLSAPAMTIAARVGLASLVLLVPAILMGATYPLVLRATTHSGDDVKRHASLLYGVNTLGAVAGVLFGGLWLIPQAGMQRTFIICAAGNLLVALLAYWASRRVLEGTPQDVTPVESTPAVGEPLPPIGRSLVFMVIALSGAVALALEIIWFRVLVYYMRPTTYAFATMLGAVLLGLALGSFIITPFLRRRANWLAVLGIAEILVGVCGLLSATGLVRSHDAMTWMFGVAKSFTPPFDFLIPLMTSALVAILPTALLLGAAFPLGVVLWTTGGTGGSGGVGRRAGSLYAGNVAGGIAGSLLAGFVMIPAFGAQLSLVIVSLVPVLGGLMLIWAAAPRWRIAALVAVPVAVALLSFNLPEVFSGVLARRYPGAEVLWHAEDAQASVAVVRSGSQRSLLIDGSHHASDLPSMAGYHRAIGLLATAVHPDPRRVLVVGLGGGSTAGGASILPNAATTVVELSPSVISAAPWFENINRGIFKNPNVTLRVGDARHHLKTTRDKFDVITADLLLPEWAGAANLYSADYYELARRTLAPRGIMVQWIAATSDYQHKMMVRSFLSAFPHVTAWYQGGILIGSAEPLELRESDLQWKREYPAVREAFDAVGFTTLDKMMQAYFTGDRQLRAYAGPGPVLRDDKPVIEYFLSLPKGSPPADMSGFAGNPAEIMVQGDRN